MRSIALLIRNGHRAGDIPEYSVVAFKLYLEAILEIEKEGQARQMLDTQLAVGSLLHKKNHEKFKEYLDTLTKQD